MKIIKNEVIKPIFYFRDIKPRETFKADNCEVKLFIKTKSNDKNMRVHAVDLENGQTWVFGDPNDVTPVAATITLEENE